MAVLLIVFIGYKVHKETLKNTALKKPPISDYLRVFFRMNLSFLGDVLKEGLKESAKTSSSSYIQKKKSGTVTNYKGIRIEGGLLPKRGTIGKVKVYFDGSFPKWIRSSGNTQYYETDGIIQVVHCNAEDESKFKFIGKSTDVYRTYK